MKRFNAVIVLILINSLLFADALEYASPQLSASSAYFDTAKTTSVAIKNPALTADIQRVTFDFSYFFLKGFTSDEEGTGHSITLGGAYPTKYGVLSSNADLLLTSGIKTTDLSIGNAGHFNLNFAKDLYSDLYFGAGLTGLVGDSNEGFDWGLGLNLGFVKKIGDINKYAKDLKLGAAINNMGKGYQDNGKYLDAAVPVFTPSAFVAFSPYENDKLKLKVASEVSFPSVSNMGIDLAMGMTILKNINIDTKIKTDIDNLSDGNYDRLIPSIYIGYNLNMGKEGEVASKYDEALLNVSANPYYNGIWAIGASGTMPVGEHDSNPPEVKIEYNEVKHVSPNFDGTNDELTFPISVTDERYIAGYEFIITDDFGNVVKSIVNKEERPENESIKNLYKKLITPKTGIPVPEEFRWDGKMDSGEMVTDGKYHFKTRFYDDNGNTTITKEQDFVIDLTKPEINIKEPTGIGLVFSPNNDGNKDVLTIPQSGSNEVQWKAQVTDFMDNPVRTVTWDNKSVTDFVWNGKDDNGQLVLDGVYKYNIQSTDLAGNVVTKSVDNIIVNTKQPPIGLTIDTNAFSPNGDNVKDHMNFVLDIPDKTGILDWSLTIKNSNGEEVNKFSTKNQGYSVIQDNIRFMGQKANGAILEEGKYTGELSVVYQNGHSPVVTSPEFVIDVTAPEAKVKSKYNAFSPNGDGNKDEMIFSQSSSIEKDWIANIVDEEGNVVYETSWKGEVDNTFKWNGKNSNGELLEDGKFYYILSSTDSSGNSFRGRIGDFALDNSKSTLVISNDNDVFSPNGDGIKDEITFTTRVESTSAVESWDLVIKDSKGTTIKEFNGTEVPGQIKWDGLTDTGKALDGKYSARLSVIHANGNNPKAGIPVFEIDTVFPVIELNAAYTLFSPDGDKNKDTVLLNQKGTGEDLYNGFVYDSQNNMVNSWFWKESLTSLEWDGKDTSGNVVDNGNYRYVVSAEDRGGNKTEKVLRDITVDAAETDIFITYSKPVFAPDLVERDGPQTFGLIVNNREGIENWSITVTNNEDKILKTISGATTVPQKVNWDGKDDEGNYTNGVLKAKFNVVYRKGNSPVYMTKTFIADSTDPKIKVTTSPTPFSPDNDYVDDELTIELGVKDLSEISSWSFDIYDPKGNPFITFQGAGKPGKKIIWDGKSSKGELVQAAEEYLYRMSVTDMAGHTGVAEGEIPVDVLVIKEGDKLKIKVSSIIFQPNSTVLALTGENGESNKKIIKRLSQILKKYSSYNIIVEGHANNIYGNKITKDQRESLSKFSKERAEEVMKALSKQGVNSGRMNTIGVGGDAPIVSFDDATNNWKNRRVEFILVK